MIDIVDHENLAGCLVDPGSDSARPECCWFDFDGDVELDRVDFAEFARLAGEP